MIEYNNACSEVYIILQDLNKEEYNRIPQEIIEIIRINRNLEYNYKLDDTIKLKDHRMLPETKAILFNLFRDYLATPEQKAKIIRMQNEERQKNELKKQERYHVDVFANKQKKDIVRPNNEEKQIMKYKENIFKRILDKIKEFFIRY